MLNMKTAVLGVMFLASVVLVRQASGQTWTVGGDRTMSGATSQPSPEAVKKMMDDWKKKADDSRHQSLGATEEEWKVLQPKMEKVQTLQSQAGGGMMMGGGMGGGMMVTMGGANQEQPAVQQKLAALAKVLANKDATNQEVATAAKEYRDAKAKAKEALEAARKELKELLTVKQEAQLLAWGMLE